MQRSFRAKLPNGVTVTISPYFESKSKNNTDLAATASRLAEMLDTSTTRESELLYFLENVASAVFTEADPSAKPKLMHGTKEYGVDLTFDVHATSGIGIVEIKTPHMNTGKNLQRSFEQLRRVLDQAAFEKPVRVAYLIAGRRHNLDDLSLKLASAQQDRLGVPVVLLSWDHVVDRLSGIADKSDESRLEIVLVEVVKLSRRLLKAILSEPSVLAGIDDRKFEELVATLFFDLGIQDVQLTPARKDGGRDIVMTYVDPATGVHQTYLVECKHWVSGRKVTMRWALSLLHVAEKERAAGAILLSSSGFGPKLLEQETTFIHDGLFLKDQRDLHKWIHVWERQYGTVLMTPINPATALGLRSMNSSV